MRVVTGALDPLELWWLADDEPDECEALVRVLTGALDPLEPEPEATPLPPPPLPPLARVATAPLLPAEPVEPAAEWWPLAPVRGALPAAPCRPRPPVATAPRGFGPCPACSWRTTCTVRRMTCVRYWTAGLRAASVATGLSDGCSVYTANPPAATAVMAAALRVCLLRN